MDEVLKWWQRSADNGYLEAQLMMGNHYLDAKNNELGRKYMSMAAEQGSIDGINNLGYIESGQTGMPENKFEALKWHRIAELLSGRESVNVKYDKMELTSTQITRAEVEARKWLEQRPTITSK